MTQLDVEHRTMVTAIIQQGHGQLSSNLQTQPHENSRPLKPHELPSTQDEEQALNNETKVLTGAAIQQQ